MENFFENAKEVVGIMGYDFFKKNLSHTKPM